MDFVIATGNTHKLEEIRRILSPLGISAISASQAGVNFEADETGSTFEENAQIKAQALSKQLSMPCVADDSGLAVDALNGEPGVMSARWAGESATDGDRIKKLLIELDGVPFTKRTARFVCAVCCELPDGRSFTVRGECEGMIAYEPCGSGGFGYDPVFIEKTYGRTMAELTDEQKDEVSHRGRALRAFAEKVREYI